MKPLSGLDVSALLNNSNKRDKGSKDNNKAVKPPPPITSTNPIPEFRQALDLTRSVDDIRDAAARFGSIIEEHMRTSFGDVMYPRAVEELGVLREEMVEMDEPGVWNAFVRDLKGKLLLGGEELGGDRRDMWREMRKSKLGLIDRKVSAVSEVGEEEAIKVGSS